MDKKKKRIILIGRSTAGKTTLCQYISKEALRYRKTQTVEVLNKTMIDTPGEYLERTGYRGALQVSSVDADVIVLVQDATEQDSMFPPAYASSFAKPSIGVVTKSDIADESQIDRAVLHLKNAGASKIFITSSVDGSGFEDLLEYLNYD
ncbi:MAG: EutP/PduV family microcompartment system protein [Clostridiales bacterium]|nr:EutP/PduV family microcompartment system protein [Clostridiales bacterium]